MAAAGAKVVVNYSTAAPDDTVRQIAELGGVSLPVKADVSQSADRHRLIDDTIRQFGRIDILVNNAGLDPGKTPFLDVDEGFFDRVMGVNLKGAYFCTQLAAVHMISQGYGRVLFVGSVQGLAVAPCRSPYAASKAAVGGLTRALAVELGKRGITVNNIAPGLIEVDRLRNRIDYSHKAFADRTPVGRVGECADIAPLAVYLACEQAGYLTGQTIVVDGGASVLLSSCEFTVARP
jgi:NAD(P)-dependent dehydrogenase (short-subunit alcohol dehydrogenase family)